MRVSVWARAASAIAGSVAIAVSIGVLPGSAASSSTVVNASIPSATTLVTTACPALDATRTSLGTVTPGSLAITSADCDVLFGSSNGTSTLRAYQPDNRGTAMASNATTMTSVGSGNRMLDVDMATSAIGWAVGEGSANARMYKTTDGGNTWVAVTDANDGLDGAGEGVDAVSTTVAWAARANSNEVARTTDGTTWSKITIEEYPTAQVSRIAAASSTHAWAMGCEVVSTSCRARIWRTANAGVDWTLAFSDNTPNSEAGKGVALSNTHVFATTTTGVAGLGVIESTDGVTFGSGAPSSASFRDVDSYDGIHVAAGSTGGAVHVSDDGGDTWTLRNPNLDASIRGLDYDPSGTIVIGTVDGSMARSPDDGVNWTTIDQDVLTGRTFGIDAVGSRIFATSNAASIARSHDDGATWILNSQATIANWSGVDGVDAGRIWRVGGAGHIQASVDGGLTWTTQVSGTTEVLGDVHAISRTTAVAVGTDGTILRTTNSGTTWSPVAAPVTTSLVAVAGAPSPYDATIWASGLDNTLIRSSDSGLTWSVVAGPAAANVMINAVAAWNDHDVIIGTTGPTNRVWTSSDGGASWTVRAGAGTIDGVMDVVAVPGTQTAVLFDDSYARRTTDGGATWTSNSVVGATIIGADLAPDNRTIWATGEYGKIAASADLGLTWTEWTGGPTAKTGFDVLALSQHSAVQVSDGNGSKTSDIPNGVADYDGAAASWSGTGFFGMCLRAAPGAGSTWPTDGTCDQANSAEWRGIPLHGGLAAASVATTLAPGTTTASFRFGMKAAPSLTPGTYLAPVTFELTAPAG